MGARLYNQATGLFTSPDPVYGGNTTWYGYPTDPINHNDLTGRSWWRNAGRWAWQHRAAIAWGAAGVPYALASAGVLTVAGIASDVAYASTRIPRGQWNALGAYIANDNPYLRVGPDRRRHQWRLSSGSSPNFWKKTRGINRQVTRFHVHVDRHNAGFDFNTTSHVYKHYWHFS